MLACNNSEQPFELIEIEAYDLIPEGITYDSENKSFFLSGLHRHKIVEYGRFSDELSNFIDEAYGGYGMGVGMKVDEDSRRLITLSSNNTDTSFSSSIHFWNMNDPSDHEVITRKDTSGFFFNDLIIDRSGNIIITDTEASRVWMIEKDDTLLQVIYEEAELYPNGITYDPERDEIYIASWQKGILRLDRENKSTHTIHTGEVKASQGIDGLYYHDNSLISIQNGYQDLSRHNIVRFRMNDNFMVSSTDTLAINHSSFNIPTTGVVVGDRFYCIANSQLDNLNQQTNEIIDTSILDPTYILGIPLSSH
ncbi:MAG: hypothetical protein HKN68_16245 [Saprospiraceae bacterium]|nr:hypothetical protein [Saprospiraceae bacterium]